MSLPELVTVHTSLLTDLGDAVRERFGVSGDLTIEEMTEIVSGLPNDYTKVEYLESSGTQYINTGISYAHSAQIVFSMNSVSNGKGVFGNRSSNYNYRMGIYYWDGQYVWLNNNVNIEISNFQTATKYTVQIGEKFDNKIIVNGNELASNITSVAHYGMFLFAIGEGSYLTSESRMSGKIYSFEAWAANSHYKFVPCIRNSDSVAGMYDIINGQFYTNAGTGTFITP